MAMPGKYDITTWWRGATFQLRFELKDAQNNPVDLTGSVLIFRALDTRDNTPTIRLATTDAVVYHTDATTVLEGFYVVGSPTLGVVELVLRPSKTRSVDVGAGTASYEIERRIAGREEVLLYGAITAAGGINDDA